MLTGFKETNKVKIWGQQVAKHSCHRTAVVAVARKLTVIMHAMGSDGTFYVGDPGSERHGCRRTHPGQGSPSSGNTPMNRPRTVETLRVRGVTTGF